MECDPGIMSNNRNEMAEKILDLTLEIIYLLTGEDYIIMKKPGAYGSHRSSPRVSEGACRTLSLGTGASSCSLIQKRNKGKKIMELIDKIIRLTLEEWDNLEQQTEPYVMKDVMMETHELFISLDGSVSRNIPDINHKPVSPLPFGSENRNEAHQNANYLTINKSVRTQTNSTTAKEKPALWEESKSTNLYIPVEYRPNTMKEELATCEERNLLGADTPSPTGHTQTARTSTYTKKEAILFDGDYANKDIYQPAEHPETEYPPSLVKEEPASCKEGNILDIDLSPAFEHTVADQMSPGIQNQSISCVQPNMDIFTAMYQTPTYMYQTTSVHNKQEPVPRAEKVLKKKSHSCVDCGKAFRYKSMLVIHQRVHTEEKPYSCQICGKSFSRKSHLITHQKIHTGEKPYSCPVCAKGFNQEANLIAHSRIHTGEKPFSCADCGRCFSRKIYLNTHRRTHTGEKPFSCPECGRCFSQKSALNTHSRTHTGQKMCSCPVCGKCFSQKSYLNIHQKIHTGEKLFYQR